MLSNRAANSSRTTRSTPKSTPDEGAALRAGAAPNALNSCLTETRIGRVILSCRDHGALVALNAGTSCDTLSWRRIVIVIFRIGQLIERF
jgi:hypothetical protein